MRLGFPLLLALASGCARALVGGEGGLAGQRPAYATAAVDYGLFTEDVTTAAEVQVRAGPAGAELSVGAVACGATRAGQFVFDGCARVYALEVGGRQGHATLGMVSPAVGPSLSYAFDKMGPAGIGRRGRVTKEFWRAVTVNAWIGLDTRLAPTSDTAAYVGVQFGYGTIVLEM